MKRGLVYRGNTDHLNTAVASSKASCTVHSSMQQGGIPASFSTLISLISSVCALRRLCCTPMILQIRIG